MKVIMYVRITLKGGDCMTQLFKALSEEARLRILSLLFQSELCVCEIEFILDFTQSNTSRHLTLLKNARILKSYKNAQWVYYTISEDFKSDNAELYTYLDLRLKQLSTYNTDIEKLNTCKAKDLCNLKK